MLVTGANQVFLTNEADRVVVRSSLKGSRAWSSATGVKGNEADFLGSPHEFSPAPPEPDLPRGHRCI
jgi:hypothetical protein